MNKFVKKLIKEVDDALFVVELDIYRCTDYKIQYYLGYKDAFERVKRLLDMEKHRTEIKRLKKEMENE